MINPITSAPCPIRLRTNIVPSAQTVPMEGEVAKGLLISGLEDSPKISSSKTGGWTTKGSPYIMMPPGANVTDVRPGSTVAVKTEEFEAGATVDSIRPGFSSGSCNIVQQRPMLYLSPLAMDSNPKVGARIFGSGIPANATVAATSEQPQSLTLGIRSAFGKLLVPEIAAGLAPGMTVEGTNIAPGTVVESVTPPVVELDVLPTVTKADVDAIFADLPITAETTAASVAVGDRVIHVASVAGITEAMIVTSLVTQRDTVVMEVDATAKTVTLSAAATVAGLQVNLVFTAPKAYVKTKLTNDRGVAAFTELVPESMTGIEPNMYVERIGVPDTTTVRSVGNGKVVVEGVLSEVTATTKAAVAGANAQAVVFRETKCVRKMVRVDKGLYTLTLAAAQNAVGIAPGMMVDAPGVPTNAMVTKVSGAVITLSLAATATFAREEALFLPPGAGATGKLACDKGSARRTNFTVTTTKTGDAARLREGMILEASTITPSPIVTAMGALTSPTQRGLTVEANIDAGVRSDSATFTDVTKTVSTTVVSAVNGGTKVVMKAGAMPTLNMVVMDAPANCGIPKGAVVKSLTGATVELDQPLKNVTPNAVIRFADPYRAFHGVTKRTEGIKASSTILMAGNTKPVSVGMTVIFPDASMALITAVKSNTEFTVDRTLPTGSAGLLQLRYRVVQTVNLAANKKFFNVAEPLRLRNGMSVALPLVGGGTSTTIQSISSGVVTLFAASASTKNGFEAVFVDDSLSIDMAGVVANPVEPYTVLTTLSASGLEVGMQVVGAGIPAEAMITDIKGDQVTINKTASRTWSSLVFQKPNLVKVCTSATGKRVLFIDTTDLKALKVAGNTVSVTGGAVTGAVTVVSVDDTGVTLSANVRTVTNSQFTFRITNRDVTVPVEVAFVSGAQCQWAPAADSSISGINVGMRVSGGHLPDGARVVDVKAGVVKLNAASEDQGSVAYTFVDVVDTTMTNAASSKLIQVANAAGVIKGMKVFYEGSPAGLTVADVSRNTVTLSVAIAAHAVPVAVTFQAVTELSKTGVCSLPVMAKYRLSPVDANFSKIEDKLDVSGPGVPAGTKVVVASGGVTLEAPLALSLAKAGEVVTFLDLVRSIPASVVSDGGLPDATHLTVTEPQGSAITPGMMLAIEGLNGEWEVKAVSGNVVTVEAVLNTFTAKTAYFARAPKVARTTATNAAGVRDQTVLTLESYTDVANGQLVAAVGVPPGSLLRLAEGNAATLGVVADAHEEAVVFLITKPDSEIRKAASSAGAVLKMVDGGYAAGMGVVAPGLPAGVMVASVNKLALTLNTTLPKGFAGDVWIIHPAERAIKAVVSMALTEQAVTTKSDVSGVSAGMRVAAVGLPTLSRVLAVLAPAVRLNYELLADNDTLVADFYYPVAPRSVMQGTGKKDDTTITVPSNRGLRVGQVVATGGIVIGCITSLSDDGEKVTLSGPWPGSTDTTDAVTLEAIFGAAIGMNVLATASKNKQAISIGPVIVMDRLANAATKVGKWSFQIQARSLADIQNGDYAVVAVQVVSISGEEAWLMAYGYLRLANPALRQFYLWSAETGGTPVKELTVPDGVNSWFWSYGPGPHAVAVFQKPALLLDGGRSLTAIRMLRRPRMAISKAMDQVQGMVGMTMEQAHMSPVGSKEYVSVSGYSGLGWYQRKHPRLSYFYANVHTAYSKSPMTMKFPALTDTRITDVKGRGTMVFDSPPVLFGAYWITAEGRSVIDLKRPAMEWGTGNMIVLDKAATLTRESVELTFTPDAPPETWVFDELPVRKAMISRGSTTVTILDGVLDLLPGMFVSGEGIPAGTRISVIPSGTMSATVIMRAWAAAHLLIEGLGLSVRDVAKDCLAVWNMRGNTANVSDDVRERVISDINAAMQLIYSRAKDLDYFNLTTLEVEVPDGSNNIALPADAQQIVGNVRMADGEGGPRIPLWALKSMAELEQFGPCYLGLPPGGKGSPQAYYIDRRSYADWNSVGMAVYIAPTPEKSIILEVDAAMSPPRFHWDDVVKGTPLCLPHAFAETLLMPIVRQRATAYKLFTNDSLKPSIEAQYQQAMEALGLVDPAPKQAA